MDRAISDEAELAVALGDVLGAHVKRLEIRRIDLPGDTTTVDVRYRLSGRASW